MNEVKAARMLTYWGRDKRRTVAVTKRDYDMLLSRVTPLYVTVDKDAVVQTVILRKDDAVNFLKAEYNLHGLRRDSNGESDLRLEPNRHGAEGIDPVQAT